MLATLQEKHLTCVLKSSLNLTTKKSVPTETFAPNIGNLRKTVIAPPPLPLPPSPSSHMNKTIKSKDAHYELFLFSLVCISYATITIVNSQ